MDWINFLKETGDKVSSRVAEIYSTAESSEIVGKGAGGDKTKKIDKVAEDLIISSIEKIEKSGESIYLISEEIGEKIIGKKGEGMNFIFADPIDGSNNAALGIPFFCVSLAFSRTRYLRDVEAAYVKNIFGDCFYAVKGGGAFLQDKKGAERKIHVSDKDEIEFLGVSTSKNKAEIEKISVVLNHAKHLRSLGSTALSLCYVACGSLNAYVDFRKVRILDITAAKLIVEEAGGVVDLVNVTPEKHNQNPEELEVNLQTNVNIIAGNKKIVEKIKNFF